MLGEAVADWVDIANLYQNTLLKTVIVAIAGNLVLAGLTGVK